MEPHRILNLGREPFSNSPDPDFFFGSRRHRECLAQLELSIQMRRGLNVVVGEVGTGKTTLCRRLLQRLSEDARMAVHLLMDPGFRSPGEALGAVLSCLSLDADAEAGEVARKEAIKSALFSRGVDGGKTVVLIIDEGQKIPPFFLEILREFLNFETNQHKLLQIVIFAQPELEARLAEQANVLDRVGFLYRLTPLSRTEVRELIDFRLKRAGAPGGAGVFFSSAAVWAVWRATRGYPRRIVDLCHQCLLAMILEDRPEVNWRMVRAQARTGRFSRMAVGPGAGTRWGAGLAAAVFVVLLAFWADSEFRTAPLVASPERSDPLDLPGRTNTSGRSGGPEQSERREMRPAPAAPAAPPAALEPDPDGRASSEPPEVPAQESPSPSAAPPPFLGAVAMASGETIGQLADWVYGTARPEVIRAVLRANDHIRSPQRIGVGERIRFPAGIPGPAAPPPVYVEVGRFEALEPAVDAIRELRRKGDPPPLRLLSCWRPSEGAWFVLVPDRDFSNSEEAEDWLRRSRTEFPLPGAVRSQWPQGTVLLAAALPEPDAEETARGRAERGPA
jgi:general secretion pathway protein A